MLVKVLFFGITHDLTGSPEERVGLPDGENLAGLCRRLEDRFPPLRDLSASILVAVNGELVSRDHTLKSDDEVAFLPPVSGGTEGVLCFLTTSPFSAAELEQRVRTPVAGAVVTFEGIVRNHSNDRRVIALEYETYERMALGVMEDIGRQAKEKFQIERIAIAHRIGRLEVGETAVVIVVSAAHRQEGFLACQYAIDQLKQSVPIWKKEHFEDGAGWTTGEKL